ncbi:MAG: hypothetical protein ACRCY9_22360, partial [Phycicoccus sp.]
MVTEPHLRVAPGAVQEAAPGRVPSKPTRRRGSAESVRRAYSYWFYAPAGVVYGVMFVVPTVVSFYYAFTRWDLTTAEWVGLDNFRQ